jgi:hypothetical protein
VCKFLCHESECQRFKRVRHLTVTANI